MKEHVDDIFLCDSPIAERVNAVVTVPAPPAEAPSPSRSLALGRLNDGDLLDHIDNLRVERDRARDYMNGIVREAEFEAERRLLARGAMQIPHPDFEVGLEPQFGAYAFNLEQLAEAKKLLPDDEGAKILKLVPERVTVIAEHLEPGPAVSISALARKYKGSIAGDLLASAMTRPSLGTKFFFRRRKGS